MSFVRSTDGHEDSRGKDMGRPAEPAPRREGSRAQGEASEGSAEAKSPGLSVYQGPRSASMSWRLSPSTAVEQTAAAWMCGTKSTIPTCCIDLTPAQGLSRPGGQVWATSLLFRAGPIDTPSIRVRLPGRGACLVVIPAQPRLQRVEPPFQHGDALQGVI
jgi:hypothetical protein